MLKVIKKIDRFGIFKGFTWLLFLFYFILLLLLFQVGVKTFVWKPAFNYKHVFQNSTITPVTRKPLHRVYI